eukprot:TRINITY_DN83035_c0_g1_i1.p1 TRINITY_DN83035_c0_g1~~TRINITY_DN83035_c0_g1_i1.p1  ORF type:complete len:601 (+),score=118.20 TRINITY_DN83035_c0_g1_i1:169-1971(+)
MGNQCNCGSVDHTDYEAACPSHDHEDSSTPTPAKRHSGVDSIDSVYAFEGGKGGVLGSSSLGSVVATRHKESQALRAVRQISKKNIEANTGLQCEIKSLMGLDHPNVCKVHESWEDSRNVYMIMELCKGGNLMHLSQRHEAVNESVIAALVWQMVSAVGHLHKNGVVHSDIRLENWMFSQQLEDSHTNGEVLDSDLKMIDYGIANKHGKPTTVKRRSFRGLDPTLSGPSGLGDRSSCVGRLQSSLASSASAAKRVHMREQQSLFCKSPEQMEPLDRLSPLLHGQGGLSGMSSLNGHSAPSDADPSKADVWALGVLAYFLLSGQSPFHGSPETKDVQIRNARYTFMPAEIWRPISAEAKNFIALCLQRDPATRPNALKALNLPWMALAKSVIEEQEHRKLGRRTVVNKKLGLLDPPLPTTSVVLGSFSQMALMNTLEKAGIIATGHHVARDRLILLSKTLASLDRTHEGVLAVKDLFEALARFGVPCQELLTRVKELDNDGNAMVDYAEFVAAVEDFQRNLQDSAVWAVFRSFDYAEGPPGVAKKDICQALQQPNIRQTLQDSFPDLLIDRIQRDFSDDGEGMIDFERFTEVLKNHSGLSK